MGFFNNYPYTNLHEVNVDYLLEKVNSMEKKIKDFTATNSIQYKGIWDITKAYEKNVIVTLGNIGYISEQPVPIGVDINNNEYWEVIANYTAIVGDFEEVVAKNTSDIAQNTSDIAQNTSDIAQNTSDIAQNTSDIAENTTNIATNTNNIAKNTSDIEKNTNDISNIKSVLSHVGMVIHSTTLDTEEKVINIYGGSSWSRISDVFLIGASESYPINSTGGEKTHTLTLNELPAHNHTETHNHSVNSLTTVSSGEHAHYLFNNADASGNGNYIGKAYTNQIANQYSYSMVNTQNNANIGLTNNSGSHIHTINAFNTNSASIKTSTVGSGNAFTNIPPYKSVYIWERIS